MIDSKNIQNDFSQLLQSSEGYLNESIKKIKVTKKKPKNSSKKHKKKKEVSPQLSPILRELNKSFSQKIEEAAEEADIEEDNENDQTQKPESQQSQQEISQSPQNQEEQKDSITSITESSYLSSGESLTPDQLKVLEERKNIVKNIWDSRANDSNDLNSFEDSRFYNQFNTFSIYDSDLQQSHVQREEKMDYSIWKDKINVSNINFPGRKTQLPSMYEQNED